MFSTLGRFTYQHRRAVVLVWMLVVVAGLALAGAVMPRLTASSEPPAHLESGRVHQIVSSMSDDGLKVVAVVGDAPVDDPRVRAEVEQARRELLHVPGVASVLDLYSTGNPGLRAEDGQASVVVVTLDDTHAEGGRRRTVGSVVEHLRAIDGASVKIGGSAVIDDEFAEAIERDLAAERKALPIAFVAMVFILGGLLAAGLPLMIAFAAVAGAMFVLAAATGVMDVSVYAINVVFMFGLGLGIDYGLLVVSRFREERAAGASVAEAVERSVATAGRTVVFSAMTVAAALLGLFAFDDPTFRSFGVAGIGVVMAALLAAITLLPALLAMWGHRVRPARARRDGRFFLAVARHVQRRAVLTVVLVGAGLAALAIPFLSATFEHGDARSLPRSSEARAVAMTLQDRFPSQGADPIYAVVRDAADGPAVAQVLAQVQGMDGVVTAELWHHSTPEVPVLRIVPEGTSQGPTAQRLVQQLRDGSLTATVEVGGTAASLIDAKDDTAGRLPYAFAIIATATLVLLFLMTGSIAVPIKAVVMNVLSLGASFGALVWGFQDGHLAGLLGFEPVGSLDLFMPVLIFIFAFGLSMDYEVFLLARIKEIYDETGDNDYAVATGLQRTGGIVTSAAFLIVVVFAGFAMGEVLGIKMLGFGLALAVVVDATIVRLLLVPATMKLLGRWNWWAPAPLRRFHERFGLHEAPVPAASVVRYVEPALSASR